MVVLTVLVLVRGLVIVRDFSCCFVSCFIISSWGGWDCVTFFYVIFFDYYLEGNGNIYKLGIFWVKWIRIYVFLCKRIERTLYFD